MIRISRLRFNADNVKSQAVWFACIILLHVSGMTLAEQPYFSRLGFLPSEGYPSGYSLPNAVSSDGSIVVGQAGSGPFIWTQSAGISSLSSYSGSAAFGVASDGTTVGTRNNHPYLWKAGQEINLEPLLSDTSGAASGITPDSAVIIGDVGLSHRKAFRLAASGMTYLGLLPGGVEDSIALGVSSDGSTVAGLSDSSQGTQAFRWKNGQMQGLGDLDGGIFWSEARAISADGSTVVGFGSPFTAGNMHEAFRWQQGTGMQPLGFFVSDGTFKSSTANGVSGDGSIVIGESASDLSPSLAPFIWDEQRGMRDLQDVLVNEFGLQLTGFTRLKSATAITPDGLTIVGYGINTAGLQEGWIAHVPEPSTIPLLGLAVPLFLHRSRRKRG